MIEYLEFKQEYRISVYNLIYNIMKNELAIDSKIINNITNDLHDVQYSYINNGGNFWVVIDNEISQVIGTVGIKKIDSKNAEFKRFYVKEDYRNRHIGYELYKIAEKFSKENGFENLYLVSSEKSKKALEIYNKNGWKLTNKDSENTSIAIRDGARLYKKSL